MGKVGNVSNAQFEKETDKKGAFVRQTSAFRERVTADGSSGFPAEPGRYHLYVCYACPWASLISNSRYLTSYVSPPARV